jgi:hypothetical protein
MQKLISFLFIIFLLGGCSLKEDILLSKSYHVTLKTSKIRISDTGFLNQTASTIELQVFSAATPIFDLHVKKTQVCFEFTCVSKKSFNQEFFGFVHYDNLLEDILTMQPIYDKKNMQKTSSGFEQDISKEDFHIYYKVEGRTLYFKDTKNNILIKMKELGK